MSTMQPTPIKTVQGIAAHFTQPSQVFHAAEALRDLGFKAWDVFSPYPMHGLEKAMGLKRSKVPFFTLAGGITGFLTGVAIVYYMNAFDYQLIVGGKPYFSPIFPFPVFYELTILLASFGTFFGMFLTNRLPQHHHTTFEIPGFEKTSDDAFCIFIEQSDPQFDTNETQALLQRLGGHSIQLIYE